MALFLEIKVIAQSGKHQLMLDKSGILKCFVTAAPEKGKANKEVIEIIAQFLKISKKDIDITSGLTSPKKRIRIAIDLSYETFLEKLGTGIQKKLF